MTEKSKQGLNQCLQLILDTFLLENNDHRIREAEKETAQQPNQKDLERRRKAIRSYHKSLSRPLSATADRTRLQ